MLNLAKKVGFLNVKSYQKYNLFIQRIVLSIKCKEIYKNMHILKFYIPICFQTKIHSHYISIVLKSCVPQTILFRYIMKFQKNITHLLSQMQAFNSHFYKKLRCKGLTIFRKMITMISELFHY